MLRQVMLYLELVHMGWNGGKELLLCDSMEGLNCFKRESFLE